METIRARFIIQLFKKNDFSICKYETVDDNGYGIDDVTILGDDLPTTKNVTYKFDGEWRENARYGRQFNAAGFTLSVGTTAREITGYLTSLPGIGEKTAARIVDVYGKDTFDALNKGAEALSNIKGISAKKAQAIIDAWQASTDTAEIYKYLMSYGVTTSMVSKLTKAFPGTVWDTIHHSPYALCSVNGFTFETVDAVAANEGCKAGDDARIKTAARSVLMDNELDGHLGMAPAAFIEALNKKLSTGCLGELPRAELVAKANKLANDAAALLVTKTSECGKALTYRPYTRKIEEETADMICQRLGLSKAPEGLENAVNRAFKEAGLEADDAQKNAVITAFSNDLTVITGGPGTGKTTIMQVISSVYNELFGSDICYLAPTGRAARRLSDSVGAKASTIHSRLHLFGSDDQTTEYDTDVTITDGLVIIDESSMIDIWVAHKLLERTNERSKIIFVGDAAQLQSVGAGAFFRDLIDSGEVPVARLSRIFRQAQGSAIVTNAQKIEDGDTNLFRGHDFEVNDNLKGETLYEAMTSAYIRDVAIYGLMQVACLVPTRKEVKDMNARIQAAINPPAPDKDEFTYGGQTLRVGDLVMELTNTETVVNGDIGIVTAADKNAKAVIVTFYGSDKVCYQKEDLDRITLAYAMTVHKAQGSEYQSVITCLQDHNKHMKIRSIPYTAITRAKTICRFYGSYRALQDAVCIDDKGNRQTLLAHDIEAKANECPFND